MYDLINTYFPWPQWTNYTLRVQAPRVTNLCPHVAQLMFPNVLELFPLSPASKLAIMNWREGVSLGKLTLLLPDNSDPAEVIHILVCTLE